VTRTDASENVTTYFYSGHAVIEAYEGADTLKREYVYGPGIDNVLKMDYHDGANTYPYYYHKDGLGSVTELTDALGRLETLMNYDPNAALLSSFAYTRSDEGDPTRISYQDGRYREYTYDAAHQLTCEEHKTAQGATLFKHEYGYDAAGNRTSKEYDDTDTVTYTPDETNELDSTSGTRGHKVDVTGTVEDEQDNVDKVEATPSHVDGVEPVTGDVVTASLRGLFWIARAVPLWDDGKASPCLDEASLRRVSRPGGDNEIGARAYDKAGNYKDATSHTDIELETSAAETFTYDADGRLFEDGSQKYYYDYEQRLIRVTTTADTLVTSFVYDALGRRVKRTDSSGNITTYFYSGQAVIEEYEGADALKREYIYGPGVDNGNASRCLDEVPLRRVSRLGGGDYHDGANTYPYYHHKDGLGSVTELTDVDGALVQAYEYDAGNASRCLDEALLRRVSRLGGGGTPTIYDTDCSVINNSGDTILNSEMLLKNAPRSRNNPRGPGSGLRRLLCQDLGRAGRQGGRDGHCQGRHPARYYSPPLAVSSIAAVLLQQQDALVGQRGARVVLADALEDVQRLGELVRVDELLRASVLLPAAADPLPLVELLVRARDVLLEEAVLLVEDRIEHEARRSRVRRVLVGPVHLVVGLVEHLVGHAVLGQQHGEVGALVGADRLGPRLDRLLVASLASQVPALLEEVAGAGLGLLEAPVGLHLVLALAALLLRDVPGALAAPGPHDEGAEADGHGGAAPDSGKRVACQRHAKSGASLRLSIASTPNLTRDGRMRQGPVSVDSRARRRAE
jgi:YD repeat-containing protein